MEHVFVYGTLRQGCSNNYLLSGAMYLGAAWTRDRFALYVHDYPCLVKDRAAAFIRGEVYLVDAAVLARLDRLENHPHWYVREKKPVRLDLGGEIHAWIYFFPEPRGRLVDCGDFLAVQ